MNLATLVMVVVERAEGHIVEISKLLIEQAIKLGDIVDSDHSLIFAKGHGKVCGIED